MNGAKIEQFFFSRLSSVGSDQQWWGDGQWGRNKHGISIGAGHCSVNTGHTGQLVRAAKCYIGFWVYASSKRISVGSVVEILVKGF